MAEISENPTDRESLEEDAKRGLPLDQLDEDEIDQYIQKIPESWKETKIKHLLTHSSGLPDMAPFTRMDRMTEKEARSIVKFKFHSL
mgnify:CR=1 FL=1